jgi:hypothetical protein
MPEINFTMDNVSALNIASLVAQHITDADMVEKITEAAIEQIDTDNIAERVMDNMDQDRMEQEFLDNIDMYDLANRLSDEIDIEDLTDKVVNNLDPDDIASRLDLDDKARDAVDLYIVEHESKILSLEEKINSLTDIVANQDKALSILTKMINADRNKSFFQKLFGG